MPCYSYLSGPSILLNANVETVLTVTPGQTNFSYSALYWVCDFPIESQLEVFTRPTPGGPETQLIYLTDYTISGTNIVLGVSPTTGYQVVIRRKTQDSRMLVRFNDGAKLTSKDLNDNFHQLLFLLQEKQLSEANIYHQYTISTAVQPWNSGTAYVANDIVLSGNALYRCILGHTNQTPPNATYWSLITATANSGFVFTNAPSNPIVINLTALSIGDALTWDGSEFIAAPLAATLNDLTDVTIASANTGDLLIYNGTAWVDQAPSFDITQNNIKFANRAFYANLGNDNSYTSSGGTVTAPGALSVFKRTTPEPGWVLTDPPTVYHILQKTIPSEADPITFFSNVNSQLTSLAANAANPVKVKLEWRLNLGKVSVNDDAVPADNLNSTKSIFWDSPQELYSASGYAPTAPSPLQWHGVENSDIIYRESPYFRQNLNNIGGAQISYQSKLYGYGIRSFYLSIPECYTTCLYTIPSVVVSGGYTYLSTAIVPTNTIINSINALGTASSQTYRDMYLLGLRDMAFAAVRADPGNSSNYKNRDQLARYAKGSLIVADYNGFEDITFKRLEDANDVGTACLWKIPKQIIYYNKAALAFADKTTPVLTTGSSFDTASVRFQGQSLFMSSTNASNSTLSTEGKGFFYKADGFWAAWNQQWSTDAANNGNKRFNEADIDWTLGEVTTGNTTFDLFRIYSNLAPTTTYVGNGFDASDTGSTSNVYYPWNFRPNDIKYRNGALSSPSQYDGLIGTHYFNIDANKLFSEAQNFIPDPMDEYVFRVVCKRSLTGFFTDNSGTQLKTSIILEHGFSDNTLSGLDAPVTNIENIFVTNDTTFGTVPLRSYSRFDPSKVKVFVKKEQIERIVVAGQNQDRLVVTLSILVPRLKSIGYSKVFRKFRIISSGSDYPSDTASIADTEIDSGPWSFTIPAADPMEAENFNFIGNTKIAGNETEISPYSTLTSVNYSGTPEANGKAQRSFTSGRNECAVKFTRLGLPSNLWIRMSILNTDGSLALLDSSGLINITE